MSLAQMRTDSVALINEARNFERIAGAGGLGGVVFGFVGGFGKGLLEAPLKAAGEGAWDCAK